MRFGVCVLARACAQINAFPYVCSCLKLESGFFVCSRTNVCILSEVASIPRTGQQTACLEICVAFCDSWASVIISNAGSVLRFTVPQLLQMLREKAASKQNIASSSSEAQRLTPW